MSRCDVNMLYVLILLLFSLRYVLGSDCKLDDVQRTAGICTHIRMCKYQIGNLRVGGDVVECAGASVCCPSGPTVAQTKCGEWTEMLHAPTSFDQPRFPKPHCASPPRGFVVGGRDADPYEYPHAVALGYGNSNSTLKFLCGATLISESHLLTAAHCLTNKRIGKPSYAVIGDITLTHTADTKQSPYRKIVPIESDVIHPDYKPPLIYNDIAILKLSSPLTLDRYVLPACLSTPLTSPRKKQQIEATGWGITDSSTSMQSNVLQAVNISTVDSPTCNEIYGLENEKTIRYPNGILKSQVCGTGNDKDTCNGDSGGGVYTRTDGCLFHVIGITSIGSKICGLGNPGIYTNVASYTPWIEQTIWK